jgi:plastocyanin
VKAKNFEYIPNEISSPEVEEVTLTFSNENEVFHNLIIDTIDISNGQNQIHLEAEAHSNDTITFLANEAGTYEIYCDEEGHEGMIGRLIVEIK